MKEELTTLNVLQCLSCIITHLKIDRSHLKKEIRCHASTVPGGASRPLSDCAVGCGFDSNCISEGPGFSRSRMTPITLRSGLQHPCDWANGCRLCTKCENPVPPFPVRSFNIETKQLQLLTSLCCGCLCLPKGAT